MDGFRVEIGNLVDAGQGIGDLMGMLDRHGVADIDADPSAVGHDGLADKLASFCDRWQLGVTNLLKDGGQIADRLLKCAGAYRDLDRNAAAALGGGSDG